MAFQVTIYLDLTHIYCINYLYMGRIYYLCYKKSVNKGGALWPIAVIYLINSKKRLV